MRAREELLSHFETRNRLEADGVLPTEQNPSPELLNYLTDICFLAFLDHLLPNSEPDKMGVFFDDLLGVFNLYRDMLIEVDREQARK